MSVVPLLAPLLAAASLLGSACDDETDYSRKERIEWSARPDFNRNGQPAELHCPVGGIAAGAVYLRANVPYTVTVEFDDQDVEKGEDVPQWFRIVRVEHDFEPGIDRMIVEVDPHPGTYKERKGCVTLRTEAAYLNEFIPIVQGYPARVEGDFDWLKYGAENPLETRGETLIAEWSAEQKEKGWESIPAQAEGTAYCYGKNGYVRLGDGEGHGANLLTPYSPKIKEDTAVMVRFKAVAYAAADGTQDGNRLTVEVTGGGQFFDGTTVKTIELNRLDPTADPLEKRMWAEAQQQFIVVSHPKNPFTSNTRIALKTPEAEAGLSNRVFIDDFYIFRLRWYDYEELFGKFPWETEPAKQSI